MQYQRIALVANQPDLPIGRGGCGISSPQQSRQRDVVAARIGEDAAHAPVEHQAFERIQRGGDLRLVVGIAIAQHRHAGLSEGAPLRFSETLTARVRHEHVACDHVVRQPPARARWGKSFSSP